jgi:hypothetical protein
VHTGLQLVESERAIVGCQKQLPFPAPLRITGLPAHTDVSLPALAVGLALTVIVIALFEVAVSGTAQVEFEVIKHVTTSLLFKVDDMKSELFVPTAVLFIIH